MRFIRIKRRSVGIGRKNSGQCDWDAARFEYIQIKTILNLRFEIVLKRYLKRSKLRQRNADQMGGFPHAARINRSMPGGFQQRKQFVESSKAAQFARLLN
jgi:hypothetical protein